MTTKKDEDNKQQSQNKNQNQQDSNLETMEEEEEATIEKREDNFDAGEEIGVVGKRLVDVLGHGMSEVEEAVYLVNIERWRSFENKYADIFDLKSQEKLKELFIKGMERDVFEKNIQDLEKYLEYAVNNGIRDINYDQITNIYDKNWLDVNLMHTLGMIKEQNERNLFIKVLDNNPDIFKMVSLNGLVQGDLEKMNNILENSGLSDNTKDILKSIVEEFHNVGEWKIWEMMRNGGKKVPEDLTKMDSKEEIKENLDIDPDDIIAAGKSFLEAIKGFDVDEMMKSGGVIADALRDPEKIDIKKLDMLKGVLPILEMIGSTGLFDLKNKEISKERAEQIETKVGELKAVAVATGNKDIERMIGNAEASITKAKEAKNTQEMSLLLTLGITALDFVPIIGGIKSVVEGIRGETFVGEKLSLGGRIYYVIEGIVATILDCVGGEVVTSILRGVKVLKSGKLILKLGTKIDDVLKLVKQIKKLKDAKWLEKSEDLIEPLYKFGRWLEKNENVAKYMDYLLEYWTKNKYRGKHADKTLWGKIYGYSKDTITKGYNAYNQWLKNKKGE